MKVTKFDKPRCPSWTAWLTTRAAAVPRHRALALCRVVPNFDDMTSPRSLERTAASPLQPSTRPARPSYSPDAMATSMPTACDSTSRA